MLQRTTPLKTQTILVATAITLLAASGLIAQAGRHPPKRVEATPAPTPEPTTKARPPAKARFSLKVVRNVLQSVYLLFPFPEKMQTWTVDRLKKSPDLYVTEDAPANHHEAVQRAKAETEAFILWLQLEDNLLGEPENAGRRVAAGEVWINVSIFAPITGKAGYAGRIVLSQTSGRGLATPSVVQLCYPTVRGDDFLLLLGSLEAANRIMDALKVPAPPDCP